MSDKAIQDILKAVRRKLGPESARLLEDDGAKSEVTEVVPFHIGPLDHYVIGCGGLPVGRLTELFSEEGAGKTSLLWHALAQCQAEGGVAALIETENGVSRERAATFGVDLSKLILIEPESMEDALAAMELVLSRMPTDGKAPNMLGWDSVAATPTKGEVEEGLTGDLAVGRRALLLSNACRVMKDMLPKARCAGVFVNQVREKIGVLFGDKTTTPGGRAIKFTASLRIQLLGGAAVKDASGHVGKDLTVIAVKNRFAPPWRKVRVRLDYHRGWDTDWTTLTHAKTLGLVPKSLTLTPRHVEQARLALVAAKWGNDAAIVAANAEDDDDLTDATS